MFRNPTFKFILIAVLLLAALGGYYAYTEYNRRNPSMADTKPAFSLSAAEALTAFETNSAEANKQYIDQVLELTGPIKGIEKDEKGFYTIVLGVSESMSSVRCVVDSLYTERAAAFKLGDSAHVRGVCVGYNADDMGLGVDLLLNRCYPINK